MDDKKQEPPKQSNLIRGLKSLEMEVDDFLRRIPLLGPALNFIGGAMWQAFDFLKEKSVKIFPKAKSVWVVAISALVGSATTIGVLKLGGDFVSKPDVYDGNLGEVLPGYDVLAERGIAFNSTYNKDRLVRLDLNLRNGTIREALDDGNLHWATRYIANTRPLEENPVFSWEKESSKRLLQAFQVIAAAGSDVWKDVDKVTCINAQDPWMWGPAGERMYCYPSDATRPEALKRI